MAFVRTKKLKGKEYRYLVESYRDAKGKVRQRTIKYLGAVAADEVENSMVSTNASIKITFEEYLNYDDGTNKRYELVEGKLVKMPPASFLHSDIIDFIADCFKALARSLVQIGYQVDAPLPKGERIPSSQIKLTFRRFAPT